jgi:hypothetical protein
MCTWELLARLRRRGFRVSNAATAGTIGFTDEQQLDYAASAGLMLLSHNKRNCVRLHAAWRRQGRGHAGVIILPQSTLLRREIRAALILTWLGGMATLPPSTLWLWDDYQAWLIGGARPSGFTVAEIEFALGRRPRS